MLGKALQFHGLIRDRHLSAQELRSLQERKLRALVQHAYHQVPYYRSLFQSSGLAPEDIRTPNDLPRIPVTRKEDLRAAGLPNIVAQGTDPSRCVILHTSGSTGKPFAVYVSHGEATLRKMLQFRAVLSVGFRPWEHLVILGPSVPGPSRLRYRLGIYRTDVILGTWPVDRQLGMLQEMRPSILWAYPSVLEPVLRTAIKSGSRIHPRLLVTSAEMLPERLRDRVQRDLGVPIFNFYGAMEVGRIAVECAEHRGLHVEADQLILECLRDGQPVPLDTPGEVVVTALEGFTMPFIRYRLDDVCQLKSSPCSCGCAFPLIEGLQGAESDLVQLPSGKLLSDMFVFILRRLDWIDQYLVVQESLNRFVVLLVAQDVPSQEVLEQLRGELVRSLGEPVQLSFEWVEQIPPQPRKVGGFVSRLAPPTA